MPESVTDRPTSAHEHVFLLAKSARYFYDGDAIRQPLAANTLRPCSIERPTRSDIRSAKGSDGSKTIRIDAEAGANSRNVWAIASQPYSGAHFATMPIDLADRCIRAGSRRGDTVLDPFGGAGTTALAADRIGRSAVLIELNPAYAELAAERIRADAPLFAAMAAE